MHHRPMRGLGSTWPTAVLLIFACCACRSGASGGTAASLPSPVPGGDGAGEASGGVTALPMPGGTGGIGFDDLLFALSIHRVLAPAGATGNLDLIDPATLQVTVIDGVGSSQGNYRGGHGQGPPSADEGRGLLFAIDRTADLVDVIDPNAKGARRFCQARRKPGLCALGRGHGRGVGPPSPTAIASKSSPLP
jgi:hypothetical protein